MSVKCVLMGGLFDGRMIEINEQRCNGGGKIKDVDGILQISDDGVFYVRCYDVALEAMEEPFYLWVEFNFAAKQYNRYMNPDASQRESSDKVIGEMLDFFSRHYNIYKSN